MKGFEVSRTKARKAPLIRPRMPMARPVRSSARLRPKRTTASVHPASIRVHSSMEPSCEPQVAVSR